ncbi:MAG: hypothetical protein IJO38_03550 [Akkermansia sp.]|nr:hypothetical protein [Akkermansia sp.]
MSTGAAITLFLLGCGGLSVMLFTRLREGKFDGHGPYPLMFIFALLMLVPSMAAESGLWRGLLGVACFVHWLLAALYFMNFKKFEPKRKHRR